MIIGRENEVKKLNEYYNSGSAELIALYGRRRVVTTYGLARNGYYNDFVNVITMDDLFK